MNESTHLPARMLDHGEVQHIESWGSDERIIEAARMSTDKGFLGWGGAPCPQCIEAKRFAADGLFISIAEINDAKLHCACKGDGKTHGDEKLLAYLYDHKHMTPFEMAGMVIEVKAPIFVFREWHRHRTQSYNEMSARYIPLPDENYMPSIERIMMQGGANKQAQSTGKRITRIEAARYQDQLAHSYAVAQKAYEEALRLGVPKELARLSVPVGRYSRMRASANLRNWLAFLTLRMDPAAQWEIRLYANAVADLIEREFPRTFALFNRGIERIGGSK